MDALWVGSKKGMERGLVTAAGIPYLGVSTAPIVGTPWWRLPANGLRVLAGTWQAFRRMRRERPDAVLVTGGYASVPVALAARLSGVPLAVFLPDVIPGRAVALVARLADRVLTSRPESASHLPKGAVVTGYPIRPEVQSASREAARRRMDLPADEPVILVFGGSQGSRAINRAVMEAAPRILPQAIVVHVTGSLDEGEVGRVRSTLGAELASRWRMAPLLPTEAMADALAAADLVVSRAGAAILGEYPALGTPALLVPLGIARGHQTANARVLEEAGAALILPDDTLTGAGLADAIERLLNDPAQLRAMAEAARSLARPGAAERIWAAVADLASAPHRAAA